FQAAPLRRRLQLEHDIVLPEPAEWGLPAYRALLERLARIEIPGLGVSGACEDLFVWPRACDYDRSRQADFEDEQAFETLSDDADPSLDLKLFPGTGLEKIIVVAGPGYGKSALLTAIAGRLANGPQVPVSVSLAALAKTGKSVIAFLTEHMNQELDLAADWKRLAEQGLLVLLLDGLDEVPSGARPHLIQRVARFSARYPLAAWMLTVRDPSIVSGLHEARTVELLPLSDEDIVRFADAMSQYAGGLDGWDIVNRLNLYPDLRRLARIPLFLAMLLGTGGISATGPANRSDLIEIYLKTLFHPADHKVQYDPEDRSPVLRPIAETLAFDLLENQAIGASEREVREIIARHAVSQAEADSILSLLTQNGILRRQSSIRLVFPYPIVQEYLAACHLVAEFADTLSGRIEDAIQRPWAQVIQFALERHKAPEPAIRAMLDRPDDAFCTGLRLVGRCIANGAKVSQALRDDVSRRLVEFWIHAPSNARERVGRLLADGFINPPVPELTAALHHRWLMNSGAGDILSSLKDNELTLSVLESLMTKDRSSLMLYRSLKPALQAAGNRAFEVIAIKLADEALDEDAREEIGSLLMNLEPAYVSRGLALGLARSPDLPAQVRMAAYALGGAPLEDDAIALARFALQQEDWDRHYRARDLVALHDDPAAFLRSLLKDENISLDRKEDLAGSIVQIIPDAETRSGFARTCMADPEMALPVKTILRLFEARFGNREIFEGLIDDIPDLPAGDVATCLALFGHHRDRGLGLRAAALVGERFKSGEDAASLAGSVATGMLHVFEMDMRSGGVVKPTAPHPALSEWLPIVESWTERSDLTPLQQLSLLNSASSLGSVWARSRIEQVLEAIDDMDGPDWIEEDEYAYVQPNAVRQLRKLRPVLPMPLIEKILASSRYNLASQGVEALTAMGSMDALDRLVAAHAAAPDWHFRDRCANAVEQLAARLNTTVTIADGRYVLGGACA
ncbi:MAG: NACHT domain-containing protein, partial [Henriciella sp.]|uniref:NACHT domain-containing protein n=1 Tax=Henriciella sp. TaxID=1968823 RepID=UPI003C7545E9